MSPAKRKYIIEWIFADSLLFYQDTVELTEDEQVRVAAFLGKMAAAGHIRPTETEGKFVFDYEDSNVCDFNEAQPEWKEQTILELALCDEVAA